MSPTGKTRKSFADKLRNKIESSGIESSGNDKSEKESKLGNKLKSKLNNNDVYNNNEFWENHLDNKETGRFDKNHDPNDAIGRYYDFMNQKKSKGGKRKSRKQRNKSRKQKR